MSYTDLDNSSDLHGNKSAKGFGDQMKWYIYVHLVNCSQTRKYIMPWLGCCGWLTLDEHKWHDDENCLRGISRNSPKAMYNWIMTISKCFFLTPDSKTRCPSLLCTSHIFTPVDKGSWRGGRASAVCKWETIAGRVRTIASSLWTETGPPAFVYRSKL